MLVCCHLGSWDGWWSGRGHRNCWLLCSRKYNCCRELIWKVSVVSSSKKHCVIVSDYCLVVVQLSVDDISSPSIIIQIMLELGLQYCLVWYVMCDIYLSNSLLVCGSGHIDSISSTISVPLGMPCTGPVLLNTGWHIPYTSFFFCSSSLCFKNFSKLGTCTCTDAWLSKMRNCKKNIHEIRIH